MFEEGDLGNHIFALRGGQQVVYYNSGVVEGRKELGGGGSLKIVVSKGRGWVNPPKGDGWWGGMYSHLFYFSVQEIVCF